MALAADYRKAAAEIAAGTPGIDIRLAVTAGVHAADGGSSPSVSRSPR